MSHIARDASPGLSGPPTKGDHNIGAGCAAQRHISKDHIRAFNKGIHGGNVRVDFMVGSERFRLGSTEQHHFSTLYGLTLDDVRALDQTKCPESLQALDRLASILFDKAWIRLPNRESNCK